MNSLKVTFSGIFSALLLFLMPGIALSQISLVKDGYFKAPGFRFLIYHNNYIGGRLGGLEMIMQGKRVLDGGNVVCEMNDGKTYGYYSDNNDKRGERRVDIDADKVSYPVELPPANLKYTTNVLSDGKSITVRIDFDKDADLSDLKNISFRIEIYPEEYTNNTFNGGGISGYFYDQHFGRKVLIPKAEKVVIAPEDPQKKIVFEGENAVLSLHDGRRDFNISGYMLFASFDKNSPKRSFALKITPSIDPNWTKAPILEVSQLGYHPKQRKTAILEVQPGTENIKELKVLYLNDNCRIDTVATLPFKKWGDLYQNTYYTCDLSMIKDPGLYFLMYDDQRVGPITISDTVFRSAWHETADIYFPTQMCHVKVKDFLRIWHGACHLDDALQAKPGHNGKDGYHQGPETQTKFKPLEHIPGINWGGWHDAADFDLPSGSIAQTAFWMALAQEQFKTTRDVTTVLKEERLVNLFEPDGKNDLLQQVAFGMEWFLAVVEQAGHVPSGVITHIGPDYGANGDPASINDGLLYDPELGKTEPVNCRSGKFDDRWLYTDRNTGGQYQFVQVAALSSRIFKGFDDNLSQRCLESAEKIWEYEQNHDPVYFKSGYNPKEDKYHSLEMAATAELFLATGDEKYRQKLLSYIPVIKEMPVSSFNISGFELVRVKDKVNDPVFSSVLYEKAKEVKANLDKKLKATPFNAPVHLGWGGTWAMLKNAGKYFFFVEAYPELFSPEVVYTTVDYVLGAHPASNHSYVSGVGAKSAEVVYGFNRADKSYQPGGVISGVTLVKPGFVEYRGRAWDYYSTEHVISGSSAYIFDALAADHLLNKN